MIRLEEIDFLRSIAIICIILAHIDSFTSLSIFGKLDGIFAIFGLSIFFFVSGYLMRLNNKFITYRDLSSFLIKRIKKIFPLYWFSIGIIYLMNKVELNVLYSNDMASNKLLFLNILGFQGFFPEKDSLFIWWFVGVILLYYFLFSIILHYSKGILDFLIYSFFAIIPFLALKNEFNLIHSNVFIFYLIYIAGILSTTIESPKSLKRVTLLYSILMFIFLLLSYLGINVNYIADIKHDILFLIILVVFTSYKIKFNYQNKFELPSWIKKVADGSYSIYLFHIPILMVFQSLVNTTTLSNYPYINDCLTIFCGIPFTLFMGYAINIYFDKLCSKLSYQKWHRYILELRI